MMHTAEILDADTSARALPPSLSGPGGMEMLLSLWRDGNDASLRCGGS